MESSINYSVVIGNKETHALAATAFEETYYKVLFGAKWYTHSTCLYKRNYYRASLLLFRLQLDSADKA